MARTQHVDCSTILALRAHIQALEEALTKMVEFGERQGWKHVYIDAARAALSPAPATTENDNA